MNQFRHHIRRLVLMCTAVLSAAASIAAAQTDKVGCSDHPLFPTRMPGYRIAACQMQDFGVYEFMGPKGKRTPVEGRFTFITYAFTGPRPTEPSAIAVVRNYENALRKIGATGIQSVPTWWVNGRIVKDGQETWAEAQKGNGTIWLRVVEKTAMEQHIVANAAAFGNDINATGHAAVYGIYFDTGKAEIKPESAPALGEIAKLLQSDPQLKIFVVGHTDNTGTVEGNVKLSEARAQSVMQALTRDHGITPARLRATGCGQYAPVASNDSEDGRSKNRRVELVKQ
jgi:outer membrane protein OmpA-like peptidoglycan-associated protein